jgi:hypothetical protein
LSGSHVRQQIDVAFNQRGFRDQSDRVFAFVQHFEYAPCQPHVALARLVGIGIDAERNRRRHVQYACQFAQQQIRSIDLRENPGLEVEAGRQAKSDFGMAKMLYINSVFWLNFSGRQ